jgi:hypothetical protein
MLTLKVITIVAYLIGALILGLLIRLIKKAPLIMYLLFLIALSPVLIAVGHSLAVSFLFGF